MTELRGLPKGILFDMGDTLVRMPGFDFAKGQARVLEIAHNPRNVTLSEFAAFGEQPEMKAIWDFRDVGHIEFPMVLFDRLVSECFGLTYDVPIEDVQIEFWKAALEREPEPGIHEVLARLSELSIPLGVVGNSSFSGRCLGIELESQGMMAPFRFVMSSADYGVRKPHPAIFRAAASKLGVAPGEIWFIGDNLEWDVAGARGAGMTAIWYNPKGATEVSATPDATLRSWTDMLDLLGRK